MVRSQGHGAFERDGAWRDLPAPNFFRCPAFQAGALKPDLVNLAGANATSGGRSHYVDYWARMILERGTGLEPATSCLEGRNSTTELPPLERRAATTIQSAKPGRVNRLFEAGWAVRTAK